MEELNRFASYNINADRVENNARAMIAFSNATGLSAPGSAVAGLGAMVEGIAGGIGRLFGAKDPMEELNRFASYNINADRVESNARAMIAFSGAMAVGAVGSAVSGLGTMIEGITGGIGRLFGAKDPMEELNRFSSYNINADRVENNARAMIAFSNAMGLSAPGSAVAGLGTMIEGITGGIGRLFGAKDPMEELNRFASYNINADRVESNARAMIAFSSAMAAGAASSAVSGLGTMIEGITGGIGRLFGANDPMEELNRFSGYDINADRVENNARAMITFSSAIANMPEVKSVDAGGWLSGTTMPWDLLTDFANIVVDKDKIQTNVDIMEIVSGFFTATPELSFSYSDESATSFNRLIDDLKDFQRLSGRDIATNARALSDAATTITNGTEGISQINDAISSNNRVRSRRQNNANNTTGINTDAGLASNTDNRTPIEIAQNANRVASNRLMGSTSSLQQAEARRQRLNASATPIVSPPTPVNVPEPVAEAQTTETDTEAESSMPVNSTDLTELVAAMISEQRITNRLLRQGNTTTRDLARSL